MTRARGRSRAKTPRRRGSRRGRTSAGPWTRLRPRDRDLLWLAYTQGLSHAEMARTLGVKTASVKLLLFRARTRLASPAFALRASARPAFVAADYGEAGHKETVS